MSDQLLDCDLLVHSAAQLLTLAGGPQRGARLGVLGIIEDGAVAVSGGRIVLVGQTSEVRAKVQARVNLDAVKKVASAPHRIVKLS